MVAFCQINLMMARLHAERGMKVKVKFYLVFTTSRLMMSNSRIVRSIDHLD